MTNAAPFYKPPEPSKSGSNTQRARQKKLQNKRGNGNYESFIKIDRWMMKTPAFHSLGAGPRALLAELLFFFNGSNNGQISYSTRQGAAALHVTKATISKWLKELVDRGFIVERSPASFHMKYGAGRGVARSWELTWIGCDGCLPRKDFVHWRDGTIQKAVHPDAQGGLPVKPLAIAAKRP